MTAVQTQSSPTSQSQKKLRVAFIGAGGIAARHLEALAKWDDAEVVALVDVNEEMMARHAEQFGVDKKHLYTDSAEMLARVEPGAVSVCTPNGLHKENTIAALDAGAHVIVEKPMAMTGEEAQEMVDAAERNDRKLVIGFQYRFEPRTRLLRRAREQGVLGEVMFGRVQAMRRRGIPNWGVFGQKHLQGGGPMIDIGVHMLEAAHYTMGSPRPVAATGMTRTYLGDQPCDDIQCRWPNWDHKTYTVEDLAVGHIRFENGAVIHIEAMFAGHIEKDVMDFQLMGTRGGCTWAQPKIFTDQLGHQMDLTPGYIPGTNIQFYFDTKLRHFVDHVLYDAPTIAPARDGLMVQQMLSGIYRSADAGGREVTID
ncbi:MAG: Gfo/Idh/MocA family protein [Phycisphaeraceae bacterium]